MKKYIVKITTIAGLLSSYSKDKGTPLVSTTRPNSSGGTDGISVWMVRNKLFSL